MASNISSIDSNYPRFNGTESTNEKINIIQNYLYMLTENLRYALNNLETNNFNDQSLADLIAGIKGPLEMKLGGLTLKIEQDGNEMVYSFTSNGLTIGNALHQIELYSHDGLLPPTHMDAQGNWLNENEQNVLEHGWYQEWDDTYTGAVYSCATYNGGVSWGGVMVKQGSSGSQGQDGLVALLNNNPHVFAGDTSSAVAGSATVGVIAMLGETRQSATIGTITGQPTGMTTSIQDNGTQNARFIVNVTSSLTTQNGTLTVPVTIGSTSFNLLWSWSVAYKGSKGDQGDPASVTFTNVNNALASLFVKTSTGDPTTVTDYYLYSPEIRSGKIYGSNIYAGQGSGYAAMDATGFEVYTAGGTKKIGLGYETTSDTDYPYLILGAGTGYATNGIAIVQKLGNGIWVGDGSIASAGGSYPGGRSTAKDISGSYPNATGLFVDLNSDTVYKYIEGVPSQIGVATFLD